jgi:hypothetical protein
MIRIFQARFVNQRASTAVESTLSRDRDDAPKWAAVYFAKRSGVWHEAAFGIVVVVIDDKGVESRWRVRHDSNGGLAFWDAVRVPQDGVA